MLRVGFVAGVTPDKWAGRWREREVTPLELVPVEEADQRAVLLDGRVDLCFVRLPLDREGLHLVTLYDELPVVVVPLDHVATAVDDVETADLADDALLWGEVPGRELDAVPMTAAEAVELVATGAGVAVMPMSVARRHHRRDVDSRPVTDLPSTTVGLAWRVGDPDPLVETFLGIVRGRTANSSREPTSPSPSPSPKATAKTKSSGKARTAGAKAARPRMGRSRRGRRQR